MSTFVGKYPPFKLDASGNILVKLTNPGAAQTPWLSNIDAAGFLLNNLGTPVAGTDGANKAYVDMFVSGLFPLTACLVATTAALTATYANGAAGVGATLTNSGAQAAISVDGVSLSVSDRVLVKNQAAPAQNGIYTVTTVGSGATNWVLTRATDFDTSAEMLEGSYTNITAGTTNQGSLYIFATSQPIVVGTTALSFNLFGVFGTMATQNANAVAITGGNINGTTIGGTTAAPGTFTSIHYNGQLTSTIADGTAPMVVTSTTRVDNLNVAACALADASNSVAISPTSTNASYSVAFSSAAGPALNALNTGAGFTYNPSTTSLSVPKVNGLTLTASTGTFTLTDAKTLSVSNTLTFTGTDTASVAFGAGGTVAYIGTAQTWNAVQTFTNSDIKLLGSSTGATTFTSANAGVSNFTLTFPAVTDTLAGITLQQSSKSADYTTVLADAGTEIYHPSTDNSARVFTIDSNANVAYPIGTLITFTNAAATSLSIAITSDTMTLAGTTTTGTRTLVQNGTATAAKKTSTTWIISGMGLT